MVKKEFQAESKRLLDLMIHSIYTHKEIFLRELISNASDALDKRYYNTLADENASFDKADFYIRIEPDQKSRTLTISDTGVGMTKEEMESNLGVIARSGSLDFKESHEPKSDVEIIGEFGVGFYSAFMVASSVTVLSRTADSEEAWEWRSEGADGYTLERAPDMEPGAVIRIVLKEDTEDEKYSDFLDVHRLRSLVRKYSDFIRYPIKMLTTSSRPKEGDANHTEEVTEDETLNSMVPIWRKNKNELTAEDYDGFYTDHRFGYEKPLRHIHFSVDGAVSFTALLYIPAKAPYDFYTKEFEKGLELYANGVMIMLKCGDLLPDYFSFVQGLVDSADMTLNLSREMLQHDRQLKLIAKRIHEKVKAELLGLMDKERDTYEKFWKDFGRLIKYGVYSDWGANREALQDLLLFHSSLEKKLVSLKEYVSRMKNGQQAIYYAAGESVEKLSRLPQAELLSEQGYEILYFVDDVDEFAIRVLLDYAKKPFQNVSEGNLDMPEGKKPKETSEQKAVFSAIKKVLGGSVKEVRASARLKSHPACLATGAGMSIEMEKVLSHMPEDHGMKAEKILEVNTNHSVFAALVAARESDANRFAAMSRILFNQALLIEGLTVDDPLAFADDIWLTALPGGENP